MTIILEGFDKFDKRMASLSKISKRRIKLAGANVILPEMQALTPVDTGELRDSEGIQETGEDIALVATAPHAPFVEFGTYKMAAQPYMSPAITNKQDEAAHAMAKATEEEIKKALG